LWSPYCHFAKDVPTRDVCAAWSLLRYRTNASRALLEALTGQVRKLHPPA